MQKNTFILKSFSDKRGVTRFRKKTALLAHIGRILIASVGAGQDQFRIISMASVDDIPVNDRLFSSRKKVFYKDVERELKELGFSVRQFSQTVQTHSAGEYLAWEITKAV